MKHKFLIPLLALLGLGSCGDPSEQFIILQNQVPQPGCFITTDASVYRGIGVLDVSLVGMNSNAGYRLHPLVVNNYPALGEVGGAEPNRIALRGFRISIELGEAAPQKLVDLWKAKPALLHYEEPWSGSAEPGGGKVATSVTAIPGELARQIRDTKVLDTLSYANILVRTRILGESQRGHVESQEFLYPIRVCAGCLVAAVYTCPFEPVRMGNACNLAQDESVDCCTDGKSTFCPSIAPQK